MILIKELQSFHMMGFFSRNDGAGFFEWHEWTPEKELEMLVFRLARKPAFLEGHVERIYHCLAYGLSNQLYGALIDLLIVLNGRGAGLIRRMLGKSRANLAKNDYQSLVKLASANSPDADLLPCRYALFTRGIRSNTRLISLT